MTAPSAVCWSLSFPMVHALGSGRPLPHYATVYCTDYTTRAPTAYPGAAYHSWPHAAGPGELSRSRMHVAGGQAPQMCARQRSGRGAEAPEFTHELEQSMVASRHRGYFVLRVLGGCGGYGG